MRTPGHDEDLAVGFLFTEGIIRARGDVQGVVARGQSAADGLINVVRVELAPGVPVDFKRLERQLLHDVELRCLRQSVDRSRGRAGSVRRRRRRFPHHGLGARPLPAELKAQQAVFEQTGGLHASGLFDADGHDRHSARGRRPAQRARQDDRQRIVARRAAASHATASSSAAARASSCMQKAKMAGCTLVAAVGAPSSLAVELAREFGMTLVGFLKADRFNVYSRPDRIV